MTLHPRHGAMDMDSMGDSGSSNTTSSPMAMMMMVFQTNRATPLYANSWTPESAGAYAGTCIFLLALAVLARLLVAFKTLQEARWLDRDHHRRYVGVSGKQPLSENIAHDPDSKRVTLSENGVEESVFIIERRTNVTRPWRFSVDPVRAVMDTVIVAVGYLLMLAVMTMNVGYFLSVLAGVFVGSLAVGRYCAAPEH